MSTKWRRSKKHLKWSTIRNIDKDKNRSNLKIPSFDTSNVVKKISSPNFRSSQYYEKRKLKTPTPLIDIFQDQNSITIIVEIVGFNKETFKIDVKDQKLTLSAKGNNRRYYKSLNLPNVVIPNAMLTKYNNGVLQIKLKKAKKS